MPNRLSVPLTTQTMEAKSVASIPSEGGWQFEPKWDGFRSLVFRLQDRVELRSRNGTDLNRYFPEVVDMFAALPVSKFVLDGELIIADASFDTLQQRLHPAASRVTRLAKETPATFEAFDCLMDNAGRSLLAKPLTERRAALEALFKRFGRVKRLRLSDYTRNAKTARGWLDKSGGALDGVVADRSALTRRLEPLIQPPGFTGNTPGAPSRWSTERSAAWEPLKPTLVVEVEFDQVTHNRFRHGTTLVRWRPDKKPRQCTFEQLDQKAAR